MKEAKNYFSSCYIMSLITTEKNNLVEISIYIHLLLSSYVKSTPGRGDPNYYLPPSILCAF